MNKLFLGSFIDHRFLQALFSGLKFFLVTCSFSRFENYNIFFVTEFFLNLYFKKKTNLEKFGKE